MVQPLHHRETFDWMGCVIHIIHMLLHDIFGIFGDRTILTIISNKVMLILMMLGNSDADSVRVMQPIKPINRAADESRSI